MKIINARNNDHKNELIKFGNFIKADKIKYIDSDKIEFYEIKKNNKTFIISSISIGGIEVHTSFKEK